MHDGGYSGPHFLEGTGRPALGDRGYRAYLRAIRDQPGLGWKVPMALCFNVAAWAGESLQATLLLIAAELVLVFGAGYLFWWRWGR